MSNEKMTVKGFKWNHGSGELDTKCESLERDMPYSDWKTKHTGMPVSLDALGGMFNRFLKEIRKQPPVDKFFKDICKVSFSKASLFRILSQEGCEQVDFFFVIPQNDKSFSLAMIGLDGKGEPVNNAKVTEVFDNPAAFANKIDATFPVAEEKGNGGSGTPPTPGITDNVVSLKERADAYFAKYSPLTDNQISVGKFMNEFVY